MVETASRSVVCRPIEERDIPAVLDCLTRGFPERRRDYWVRGLEGLSRLPRVDDYPQYGRLLEADGAVVGVMLQIFSRRDGAEGETPRCNLSSWCVDPAYRGYGHALHARAVARREVVYLNISAAPHTVPALNAVGYRCYSQGQFVFAPLLSRGAANARVVAFAEESPEAQALSTADRRLLADHAAFGCLALVGVKDGAATPLVFQKRTIWRGLIPCLHVIYCRDPNDLTAFSAALGRRFARAGRLLCVLDANGPVPGLAGRFLPGRELRYFKGAAAPQPCDLAYTEIVVLGR
jgi:hypothetical protein